MEDEREPEKQTLADRAKNLAAARERDNDPRKQAHDIIWGAYLDLQETKFDGTCSEHGWKASSHLSDASDMDVNDGEEWLEFVEEVRSARDILLANAGKNNQTERDVLQLCNQAMACIGRTQGPEVAPDLHAGDGGPVSSSERVRDADTGDAETEPEIEEGTYWRQEEGHRFTLLIGNVPQAQVIDGLNVAFLGKGGEFTHLLAIPDSRTAFDEVEEYLRIGRVDEILGIDGRPAAHLRHEAEDQAAKFSRQHPPSREPQYFLRRAWDFLNQAEKEKMLSPEAEQARTHVQAALRDFENHGNWTPYAREQVNLASERAFDGEPPAAMEVRAASIECEKAAASLEYGRAAERTTWRDQQRAFFRDNANGERDRGEDDRDR